MVEHSRRYDDFMKILCDAGYVCYIHDNLGHGNSVQSDDDLGYFGGKEGYKYLIEDSRKVTELACGDYPDLPIVLFGHSMGSFIVRMYTAKYGNELSGAIYCGTGGSNPAVGAGIALTKLIFALKGGYYRSNFITNLAFGSYNKRIENATPISWQSRNIEEMNKFIDDDKCGFTFTTSGYLGLLIMNKLINIKSWYESVPKNLPILLMAGEQDPVGAYGKGVIEVYDKLKASNHSDVTLNLYPDDRHEILNELDRDKVIADTLE